MNPTTDLLQVKASNDLLAVVFGTKRNAKQGTGDVVAACLRVEIGMKNPKAGFGTHGAHRERRANAD